MVLLDICITLFFFGFIRHSAEFLRGWVFQDLKEPISSLLFCLLR